MEIKLILGLLMLMGIGGLVGWAEIETSDKNKLQAQFDEYKLNQAQEAATAIAAITKEKEDALTANEAIQLDYQNKLSTVAASATVFAQRLRNAEATIAANRSAVPKDNGGQGTPTTSAPSSADQLGQLVTLVTGLRTECAANSDQLDALIGEVSKQL
jgi:hypothetical protein